MDIRYFPGYKFVCPDKLYPKEACDVRTQYSSIFPFSSNKNCQSDGHPGLNGLRILAVDEIAIRKGHRYLTVVPDYLGGRILFLGKDRKAKTLKRFFNTLSVGQRKAIEAVAMDMWDPFIKAVKKNCLWPKLFSIFFMCWPISAV